MGARVMVLNATFNNISVISWRSVLLVEEVNKQIEKKIKYVSSHIFTKVYFYRTMYTEVEEQLELARKESV
jgi:hypothetical protein